MSCSVCGGVKFVDQAVLWDDLANEWQLAPHERSYVDRQQGTHCISCGSNLRSIALADAILASIGSTLTLTEFVKTAEAERLALLEINEAGTLSPMLKLLPGHVLATYPAVDMQNMPYAAESFDLVIHSDTLEHVPNPVRALAECRRVLRPNGSLCITIPTIVGRMSRSRVGLPKSFHGSAKTGSDDYLVQTEFGADMWTYFMLAGFKSVAIDTVDFPSALALRAKKGDRSATTERTAKAPVWNKSRQSIPDRIISVHFPKAGGTSLKIQFENIFKNQIVFEYDNDPLITSGTSESMFPDDKKMVHGHFSARRHASTEAYRLTFVRHPVDNLISIYFFWKSLATPHHDLHARFLRENPSILEFARFPGIRQLMSETYFGGFDMRRFDFIGFHETRTDDIARLARELGLPLSADVHANATAEHDGRFDMEQNASLRLSLTDILAEDVAFYERLRR